MISRLRGKLERKEDDRLLVAVAGIVYEVNIPCCYENEEPPKNPHYNADTTPWPVSSAVKGGADAKMTSGCQPSASGRLLHLSRLP